MHKIIVILLSGILMLPRNGNTQHIFYSQSLQNLYYSLPEMCKVDVSATDMVVLCNELVQGDTVPLAFCFDENKILEHIGYRFLPNNAVTVNNAVVRFIERELLTLLLTRDMNQTFVSHKENGLSILLNGKPIKQGILQNRRSLMDLMKNNQSFAINYDSKKYEVLLLCENEQKLSFHFPADSELLTGMDKQERDIRLAVQLKNHKAKPDNTVAFDYSYLQSLRDTIYVDKGSSFMIPQINNDIFYAKIDSAYSLIFDSCLLAETFSNTLVVPANRNYSINIMHKMYGKQVANYTVNSHDFDDYFRHDYDRYFGAETLEKERLTGTLILKDRNADNIHLAFVSVSLDNLLKGGTMEIQLYSNIPQQNVKTLFGKRKE